MTNSIINKYNAQLIDINSSFERQIERMYHDPIRLCDGANEGMKLRPVKAVLLG